MRKNDLVLPCVDFKTLKSTFLFYYFLLDIGRYVFVGQFCNSLIFTAPRKNLLDNIFETQNQIYKLQPNENETKSRREKHETNFKFCLIKLIGIDLNFDTATKFRNI